MEKEKYVYLLLMSFCIFLELTSTICHSLFFFLFGIICAIAACRVFIFRKYELFLLLNKGTEISASVKIIAQCVSMMIYLIALSLIAIGSWLYLQ